MSFELEPIKPITIEVAGETITLTHKHTNGDQTYYLSSEGDLIVLVRDRKERLRAGIYDSFLDSWLPLGNGKCSITQGVI